METSDTMFSLKESCLMTHGKRLELFLIVLDLETGALCSIHGSKCNNRSFINCLATMLLAWRVAVSGNYGKRAMIRGTTIKVSRCGGNVYSGLLAFQR